MRWLGIPPTWAVAAAAVLLAAAVALAGSAGLFVSYLFVYLFLLGIALGSMAVLMLHDLTGGPWADAVRPALLAAAGTLPLLAVLFVPIAAGLHPLYSWSVAPQPPEIQAKAWFLNAPFFYARAVAYFAIWLVLAHRLRRFEPLRETRPRALLHLCAAGLIVYALTVTLAAVDWIMSLTPHWYSTTFGLMIGIGQMLSAMAFGIVAATWAKRAEPDTLHDLGNMLLMFVMTWAYLAFMQYLIIWIENLPREIDWYVPRVQTSWRALGWVLVLGHFAVPFCVLLGRRAKRSAAILGTVAAGVLAARAADLFWLVAPTFRPEGFALRATDLLAAAGLGAVWLAGLWLAASRQATSRQAASRPGKAAPRPDRSAA